MIHTMTDETYAVNCTIEDKDETAEKRCFSLHSSADVTGCLEQ